MPDRAILFIDGNNWYHALVEAGVPDLYDLKYRKISEALVGPRTWIETRYYIGALKQDWNPVDYANQRRFLAKMQAEDTRISVHLGRLERRPVDNPLVTALRETVRQLHAEIPREARNELYRLAQRHEKVETLKEKAVDVMLAVDVVRLAYEDKYDAAYILSADGDFTPPVEAVRAMGKTVYAAAPMPAFSSHLNRVANKFIRLDATFFMGCH